MDKERRTRPIQIEQSYRSLVENIKDYAIFMLDKNGNITSWDQGGVKLFGYDRDEIIGKNFSVLFTDEDIKKGVPDADLKIAAHDGQHLDERQYIKKNRKEFWSSGVLTATRDKHAVNQGFSKIMRDISQQNELHATAVHNSTHDFLTGLPNRNFFEESLINAIPETKQRSLIAVIYMDFDNFKSINDKYGHGFGDLVLIEIAHRLSHSIRISDVAARFGGDEFVILAKQLESKDNIIRIAEKTLKDFHKPIHVGKESIETSASIGIAVYPTDARRPGDLLRFSDRAMYHSKQAGGNRYQFYSEIIPSKK